MQNIGLIIALFLAFNAGCIYIKDTKASGCMRNAKASDSKYPAIWYLCGISLQHSQVSKFIENCHCIEDRGFSWKKIVCKKCNEKFRQKVSGIKLRFCQNSNSSQQIVRPFILQYDRGQWGDELRCPDGYFINMLQVAHGLQAGVLVGLKNLNVQCAKPGQKSTYFYRGKQKYQKFDRIASDYEQSFISGVAIRFSMKQAKIWGLIFNFERFPIVVSLQLKVRIPPDQKKENKKTVKLFLKKSKNPGLKNRNQYIKDEWNNTIIMRCNTTHHYLQHFSFQKRTSRLQLLGVVKKMSKYYPGAIQQISQFKIGLVEAKVQTHGLFTYEEVLPPKTQKTYEIRAEEDQNTEYQLDGVVQISYGISKVDQKISKIQFKGKCTGLITHPPYLVSYETQLPE